MAERGVKFLFQPGEHVLCFEPDPAKARVLYEAKVLETSVVRDRRGRKKAGYQIHFQGWNSSWDRVVPENFVLKNSDDNRQLMRRLVHTARHIRKNKARRRRIDEILRIHFNNTLRFDDDRDISAQSPDSDIDDDDSEEMDRRWQDGGSDEATEDYDCDTTGREDEASDNEDADATVDVDVSLPENLRRRLEDDWMSIKQKEKLVRLPATPSVIQILEGYVQHIAVNSLCATGHKLHRHAATPGGREEQDASKTIDLCKEVTDGVRIAFDFCLPSILLYDSERAQFDTQSTSCRPSATKHNASEGSASAAPGGSVRSPRHRNPSGGHSLAVSTHNAPSDEPPTKLLHIKQEINQEVDETPSRRITRHSFAVKARKTKMSKKSSKSSAGENKSADENKGSSIDNKVVIEEVNEVEINEEQSTPLLRRNSLRSRMRHGSGTTLKSLADCISPPPAPPAVTSSNCPPASVEHKPNAAAISDGCTPKKPDQITIPEHDALVNEVLSWQLIPPEVYTTLPPPPSTIYGAQHLLRLFVKLPDLLQQMTIPRMHLQHLTQHLEMFLGYLSERIEELFPVSAYVEHQEYSIHGSIKGQSTKHVGRTI